ncbi:class I SAM-dependent methyltransferase [Fodinicurvata halophila]|uniref:class I SAM-dependent methyltransferase n=1 Tax=Fodinicurvata halophila TaxID=1419723 RepID=UPI003640B0BE
MQVYNAQFLPRFLLGGSNGFAQAYMAGHCDSPDLPAFLHLAALNMEYWSETLRGNAVYRGLQRMFHLARPNSRNGSKRNIAYHYDLGNDFYRAWLDESMTYSAALFEGTGQSLAEAQVAKYRRMAEYAGIQAGDHVLEIGCGWGGFAEYLARAYNARVTAITISDEQYAYACERIRRAGLEHLVEIRHQDYRDLDERFDRIVSIEMLEAVGERYWPLFFERLRACLKPRGRAALQVITISNRHFERYRRGADFIQRHIFPGGMLPSPEVLQAHIRQGGLVCTTDRGFGPDYARTLAIWRARFEAAWPRLDPGAFDERFRRMWTYYLAYCEAGFRTGRIDVRHVALAHS